MTNNEKALEKVGPASISETGVILKSFDDLMKFAEIAVSSGACPKSMTAGAAAMAIQAGLERGLGLLGGMQQIVVINGLMSWRGQGAYALIQNSGVCKPGSLLMGCVGEGDERIGWAKAWRIGYTVASRVESAVKDARQAGLWGKQGPWSQYPARMLMWRAFGFLARDVFPDVLGGFPLADEAADYEPVEAVATEERPTITAAVSDAPVTFRDPLLEAVGVQGPVEEVVEANTDSIVVIESLSEYEALKKDGAAVPPPEQEKAERPEPESVTDAQVDALRKAQESEMSHEEADKELAKEDGLFK